MEVKNENRSSPFANGSLAEVKNVKKKKPPFFHNLFSKPKYDTDFFYYTEVKKDYEKSN